MSPHFVTPLPRAAGAWPDPSHDLVDRLDLVAHMQRCAAMRGRWFNLRCAAEALRAVVAPRIVTSLIVVVAFLGVISIAL
jgi:hypothetical protein